MKEKKESIEEKIECDNEMPCDLFLKAGSVLTWDKENNYWKLEYSPSRYVVLSYCPFCGKKIYFPN